MSGGGPAPGGRYFTLDHWRGFAALWVLVFHGFGLWLDGRGDWLSRFIGGGWLGVHVFFVISGYCIMERTAREYRARGSALRFLADRFLRIYPPFWAALALSIVLNVAGAAVKHQPLFTPGQWPHGVEWLTAASTAAHWLEQPTFLLVAWTLSYELGFYLIAAFGLALARWTGRPLPGLAWGAVLSLAGLLTPVGLAAPLLAFWPHFALGSLVWVLQHRLGNVPARLALGSLLIGAVWAGARAQGTAESTHLLFACAAAWLLLALQPWDARISAWRGLRWLGFVGTFSYSLYLIHSPLVGRCYVLLERSGFPGPAKLAVQAVCCLLTVAAAWLFYRRIEVRSEALRRAWIARPGRTPS